MSLSWSFYAFDSARFKKGAFDPHLGVTKLRNLVGGSDTECDDRKLLTRDVLDTLTKHGFDYNKLPKKLWKLLDAYVRVYVCGVMEAEALSELPCGADKWQKLLRFYLDRNGKDTAVFAALAEAGRRHDLQPAPTGWLSGISNALYRRPERYLIVEGKELDTFCRHLQVLFYVNAWDWPTYLPAQELLKPTALEPFLAAREKGQAVFALLSEKAVSPAPTPVAPAPEIVPQIDRTPVPRKKKLAGVA